MSSTSNLLSQTLACQAIRAQGRDSQSDNGLVSSFIILTAVRSGRYNAAMPHVVQQNRQGFSIPDDVALLAVWPSPNLDEQDCELS